MMNALVVYKKSTYDYHRRSPDPGLRRFAQSRHQIAVRARAHHEENLRNLESVIATLDSMGVQYTTVHRARMDDVVGRDLVIAVGGDGTFLEASHYIVNGTPILGVNSVPSGSVGFFLAYVAEDLSRTLANLESEPRYALWRAITRIDGQRIGVLALNELQFRESTPAGTASGMVSANGATFRHKGDGIVIAAAAGSSGIIWEMHGELLPLDSRMLQYRELGRRYARSGIAPTVEIESLMREGSVFIDGKHLQYPVEIGTVIQVEAGEPLTVIGDLDRQRKRFIARVGPAPFSTAIPK